MKLTIMAETKNTSKGFEARSPDLRLTAHGHNQEEAIQSLQRGITAWCNGLQSLGKLQMTLTRKHLNWEGEGQITDVEIQTIAT